MTQKQWDNIHAALTRHDLARRAEGYAVAYRRIASYKNVSEFAGPLAGSFGEHVETMYLNNSTGKSLLVKVLPDGTVSAFERVKS